MSASANRSVLIVEDDADIRESLREAFEDQGYVVECAANGHDGREVVRRTPPSVIVLDLMMPVMDGVELFEWLKSDQTLARVPVVVSTSDPSRAPSGVVIVKKPIDLGRLLSAVATLCR